MWQVNQNPVISHVKNKESYLMAFASNHIDSIKVYWLENQKIFAHKIP